MPSASSGETWPKRLPRPGPFGSKVSKLWNSTIRPISGATTTAKASRRGRRAQRPAPAASAPGEREPERRGDREPDQPREAVGVDGADRDQRRGDESQRRVAPGGVPRRLAQGEDEGEDEEGLHRLLEGALGEVGGDQVGEADDERGRRSGAARGGSGKAASAVSEASTATATVRPSKPWTRRDPEALVRGRRRSRAARADSPGAAARSRSRRRAGRRRAGAGTCPG